MGSPLLRALGEADVPIYASGMSAKARDVDAAGMAGSSELDMPSVLVELTMASDRVLTYEIIGS